MGILKKIWKKFNSGIFYIVDKETLEEYLKRELNFSIENNLEASANLNIYLNGEKNHVQVWNHSASKFKSEQEKGIIVYYNDEELNSIEALFEKKLNNLPDYFKIELINFGDTFLYEYKKNHPELKIEDYN